MTLRPAFAAALLALFAAACQPAEKTASVQAATPAAPADQPAPAPGASKAPPSALAPFQTGEFNKLVIALKMRFMHLLDAAERQAQIDLLADTCEAELRRLHDLRQHHRTTPGTLSAWLDHDIAQIEQRAAWFRGLAVPNA